MKIFKYELNAFPSTYTIPFGATFLCVQTQFEKPQMWFLVEPSNSPETRRFVAVPTGEAFDSEGSEYRGTFQLSGGALVFHLFEYV